MRYRGVIITKEREMIPGSNIKELKDGRFVECKPKFYPPVYKYAGSYPYSTLKECKESIDAVFNNDPEYWSQNQKEFERIMNSDESLTQSEIDEIMRRTTNDL